VTKTTVLDWVVTEDGLDTRPGRAAMVGDRVKGVGNRGLNAEGCDSQVPVRCWLTLTYKSSRKLPAKTISDRCRIPGHMQVLGRLQPRHCVKITVDSGSRFRWRLLGDNSLVSFSLPDV
jgi:hypothetical protein